jgi:hypothetical protein
MTPFAFRTVAVGHLLLLLFQLTVVPATLADERRHSGADTERHPARTVSPKTPASHGDQRLLTPSVRGRERTLLEEVDPAVRQYWSDKCVQQRARGWGHTGDCNHPAYSGNYYRQPPIIVVPESSGVYQRRRGHIGVERPRSAVRGYLR